MLNYVRFDRIRFKNAVYSVLLHPSNAVYYSYNRRQFQIMLSFEWTMTTYSTVLQIIVLSIFLFTAFQMDY